MKSWLKVIEKRQRNAEKKLKNCKPGNFRTAHVKTSVQLTYCTALVSSKFKSVQAVRVIWISLLFTSCVDTLIINGRFYFQRVCRDAKTHSLHIAVLVTMSENVLNVPSNTVWLAKSEEHKKQMLIVTTCSLINWIMKRMDLMSLLIIFPKIPWHLPNLSTNYI